MKFAPLLFLFLIATIAQGESPPPPMPGATAPLPADRWKNLPLSAEERNAAAKALATHVRNGQTAKEVAANLLALALALDPTCKEAVVANFQISRDALKPVTDAAAPAELVKAITAAAGKLKDQADADSKLAATHLYYAAGIVDPGDENSILEFENLRAQKFALDWNIFFTDRSYRTALPSVVAPVASAPVAPITPAATAPAAPTAIPRPAAKSQTKMKGLWVRQLGQGKMVGKAFEIIASQSPPLSATSEGGASIISEAGPQARTALKNCYTHLMAAHPNWSPIMVRISFDDQYTKVEGPSATTVYGILITSLQDGIDLDPTVAITGDLSGDQVVRPVGGVRGKVIGAIGGECSMVGVPSKNLTDIQDALVMLPDASLITKIQVFSLSTMDEALTLARKDRPADYQAAIDSYRELMPSLVGKSKLTEDQLAKLEEIVKKAPNHLSALLLLQRQKGTWPKQLSLRGSVEDLLALAEPFYERINPPKKEGKDASDNRQRPSIDFDFSSEFYISTLAQLATLKPRVHKDAAQLANRLDNSVRMWRSLNDKLNNDPSAVGSIRSTATSLGKDLESFEIELRSMLADEKKAAEIND